MNKQDFVRGIFVLEDSFPRFHISSKEFTLEVWYKMFKDETKEVWETAIERFMAMSKFDPTVSALRECVQDIKNPASDFTADQAWNEVMEAIRHCGTYHQESGYALMSPMTLNIVKSMGYRELCLSENNMADRAHFIKMFEQYKSRERKEFMLPDSTREKSKQLVNSAVKELTTSFKMPETSIKSERCVIDESLAKYDDIYADGADD